MRHPPIYGKLSHEFAQILHRHRPSLLSPQEGPTMTTIAEFEADVTELLQHVHDFADKHHAAIAEAAHITERAATSPLATAALAAVGLPPALDSALAAGVEQMAARFLRVASAVDPVPADAPDQVPA